MKPFLRMASHLRVRLKVPRKRSGGAIFTSVLVSLADQIRAEHALRDNGFTTQIDPSWSRHRPESVTIVARMQHADRPLNLTDEREQVQRVEDALRQASLEFRFQATWIERSATQGQWKWIFQRELRARPIRWISRYKLSDIDTTIYCKDAGDERVQLALLAERRGIMVDDLKARRSTSPLYWSRRTRAKVALFATLATALVGSALDRLQIGGQGRISTLIFVLIALGSVLGILYLQQGERLTTLLSYMVLAIPFGVASAYAVTRYVYVVYYEVFRISPEDVGADYRYILSHQYLYILIRGFVIAIVVLSIFGLGKWFHDSMSWRAFDGLFLFGGVALVVLLLIGDKLLLPDLRLAQEIGQDVQAGLPPESGNSIFFWPVIIHARADATSDVEDKIHEALVDRDLLVLGQSNGTTVFYDFDANATVRVPSIKVITREFRADRIVSLSNCGLHPSTLKVKKGRPSVVVFLAEGSKEQVITSPFLQQAQKLVEKQPTAIEINIVDKGDIPIFCRSGARKEAAGTIAAQE